ncbi:MAG: hypothetical protein M8357_15780, partial [Desulfobulbaceae bacterium]|nr:hypothetical protein [Desulfobulbaceae bacterium]
MKKINLCPVWIVIAALCAVLHASPVFAFGSTVGDWPREIKVEGGSVVMYQPQPEQLDGNLLKARAAISVKVDNSDEMVFGAVWFDARLYTDRDKRKAAIADVMITEVRFPDQQEEREQGLTTLLEREMVRWDLDIDLDRLAATLELAERREIIAQGIDTSPPEIIFIPEPAVLVVIDGEPRLKKTESTGVLRVVNTPFSILLSPSDRRYYLYAGRDTWYTASDIEGNWEMTSRVPLEIAVMAPDPDDESLEQPLSEDWEPDMAGPPPVIIVSTEPAELISSYGEPEYTPISRTSLLYMSNTDSDVLLHIAEQRYYVLLAGRWYRSPSLQGPWDYVAGEDLPADFSMIPEDSQVGTVLYAVPGTDLAREAVLDAHIPQTAAVDPNKASLRVEFDGKPKFEQISGTSLYYAVNTAIPVIWTGNRYYACDQAVWFVAPSPKGPWTVATYVPDAIYLIPPDSPVYNVTFVRVYEATPEVVYVGYTPGYTHTYVYHNTIVYGTGYNWSGWYGSYYYPRHDTWGYHPRWNPWSGWSFGLSYSAAPFYFSIGTGSWYRGSWWGPTYYRSYRHNYYHRYRREKHIGYRAGYVPPRPDGGGINIYRSKRNKVRLESVHDRPILWGPGAAPRREKNVYVDRQGNIHRRTDQERQTRPKDRWLQREGGKPIETRRPTGPAPGRQPKFDKGSPVQTRPSTGPSPGRQPKFDKGSPVQTRPSTG